MEEEAVKTSSVTCIPDLHHCPVLAQVMQSSAVRPMYNSFFSGAGTGRITTKWLGLNVDILIGTKVFIHMTDTSGSPTFTPRPSTLQFRGPDMNHDLDVVGGQYDRMGILRAALIPKMCNRPM